MVYTDLTNKALRLAYQAHHGQLDYNGIPYVFHPLHLAEQMQDEISCCAALLHDVVEDTEYTLDDLRKEFPESVVEIVALLTHDSGADYSLEDYFENIRAIKKHPIARIVKLADLRHNCDQSRCVGSGLSKERLQYWQKKYETAIGILTAESE